MSGVAAGRRGGFRSLRGRMLLSFGLAVVLGIFAVDLTGLYGVPFTAYRGEYGQRRSENFRDLSMVADLRKAELARLINGRRADAVIFSESPLMRRLVGRAAVRLRASAAGGGFAALRSALLRSDEVRSLGEHLAVIRQVRGGLYERIDLADAATGAVIASSDAGMVGSDLSGIPYFSEMREGVEEENVNELRDPRSGGTRLAVLHTVRDVDGREGEVAAILVLYLRPDLFVRALETGGGELGTTGETYLVNEEKVLLTSLKRPLRDGTVPRPLETRIDTRAATLAVEGNEGIIAVEDYAGVPVLAAFRHLRLNAETGLGMVVKQDQSEIYAPLRQLVVYMALKAVFSCLLALGMTYAIATRITGPIRELSHAVTKVEAGDLGARASVSGTDEVGVLAGSFNAMVQRIQHWREELEAEVQARTAELVDMNTELECQIDERGRVEEALRTTERRFRELLETVQLIAVILDPVGTIVFCNEFLLRHTGWRRDEVIGRNWFELFISPDVRKTVESGFGEAIATATVAPHIENQIVTKTGVRRTVTWDSTLLRNPDGSIAGIASLGTDITEQRSLEELFRQSQKMEAVGQLAGGVAHDFNNLLTAIIGNCELIKLKLGPDSPAEVFLEQILKVSAKAAKLTHGLLAFSRKQILSTATVDLNDCVGGVEDLLSRLIGEDIDFRLALTATKLPVRADRHQLEQVLVNLATNARDAMPAGGELLIETRRTDLDRPSALAHGLDREGAYAVILVSDTGCGMDETTRERIFEPFFTTKEVGKGTGLGLAMVFGTIRQHGGHLAVFSEVGRGTVFTIYLPLIQEGPAEGEAASELPVPGGEETLLVVEDNVEVRKVVTEILETRGYRVIVAADGEEAVRRFSENRDAVRLVIMDVVMPKMSGRDACEAIKAIRPDVRVLFTSGYTADLLSANLLPEGELHFLQKPVPPRELLCKVRELLDR